jgi:hypothetical protein
LDVTIRELISLSRYLKLVGMSGWKPPQILLGSAE